MTIWHEKSNRKESGGIRRSKNRATKRLHQKGGVFAETTLAKENETKVIQSRGKKTKTKVRKAHTASVTNPQTGKTHSMNIVWVHENAANRLYVRRNIITHGTLIEVEGNGTKAFARVTSRPGQDGTVNAILTEKPAETKKTPRAPRAKGTSKKPIVGEPIQT